MNLVALSVVLLAFASTFCNEVCLFPKRDLSKSSNGFPPFFLWNDANSLKYDGELKLPSLFLVYRL
jgi:hypothetical protein